MGKKEIYTERIRIVREKLDQYEKDYKLEMNNLKISKDNLDRAIQLSEERYKRRIGEQKDLLKILENKSKNLQSEEDIVDNEIKQTLKPKTSKKSTKKSTSQKSQ